MVQADWHTYQVLTKRAVRMASLLCTKLRFASRQKHIWWGVSVEDKKYGVPRVDELRRTEAGVKFLSIEPLLEDLGALNVRDIDWVIVGGESGPGARPMAREWVTSLRHQCRTANVRFFFKQWGGTRKHLAGRMLDGRTYDELPPTDHNPIPIDVKRQELIARAELMSKDFVPVLAVAGD